MSYEIINDGVIPAVTGGVFDFAFVAEVGTALEISPAYIIAEYLRQNGVMTDPDDDDDWPLFVSYFPDNVTEMGAVYDTTGIKKGRYPAGEVVQDFGGQIRLASNNPNTCWSKAEAICAVLDAISWGEVTVESKDFIIQNVRRTTPPIYNGVEEGTSRRIYTINFIMMIKRG